MSLLLIILKIMKSTIFAAVVFAAGSEVSYSCFKHLSYLIFNLIGLSLSWQGRIPPIGK